VRLSSLWSCAHVRVPWIIAGGDLQGDVTANPKRLPFYTPSRLGRTGSLGFKGLRITRHMTVV
jgi:hypothetical protein